MSIYSVTNQYKEPFALCQLGKLTKFVPECPLAGIIPEFFTAATASLISSTGRVRANRTNPFPSFPKLLPGVHKTPDFSKSSMTKATSSS